LNNRIALSSVVATVGFVPITVVVVVMVVSVVEKQIRP
jgi:hypothetical protein